MTTNVLDHIVHLTPPGTVEQVSSEFRKLGFDVIPGGTHAGGLTYNALVVLPDGVYLELIAFVHADPPPPPHHRWGGASPAGWIDFAHLGLASDATSRVINDRAARDGSGVAYCAEVDGGRDTPAGRTVKWRIAAPEATRHGVGRLPFFCGDVTPREWRVPPPGDHPCTAQGISHVKLLAASNAEFAMLVAQLSTVVGGPPASASHTLATWDLETPRGSSGRHARLILEYATDLDSSSGIHEVGFWVAKGGGGQADSPYGKIVWTPLPHD